ncbi:MAG: AtpZ/AtpI family protein [Polyangiaceae bacterium]|jgi:ATP synthase protein I
MSRDVKPWKEYGRYGSVGIELVLSIMLGYYAGHWLDGKVGGGHGWLTAIGSVVGVYAGFRAIFSAAKHMEADILRAERRERGEDPWGPPASPPSPPDASAPTSTSKGNANANANGKHL